MRDRLAPLALAATFASAAQAGSVSTYPPTLVGGGDRTETKGYAGLNWDLPGGLVPSVVVGVRRAKIDSDGDTRGGDLSFSVGLAGGTATPAKLRLKGFAGDTNHQWELGGGYNFASGGFFAGPSVTFPHFTLGADWQASGLNGYGIVHTWGEPDQPAPATPTCNPGDTYNAGTGLCETGGGGA